MKLYKSLLATMALALMSVSFTACDEDEAVAPLDIPKSEWKANTTIADFKAAYWKSDDNYNTQIGTTASGEHMVISGRVIGNDLTGNIYQNLMIQDSTAAVVVAVKMSDMNVKYKIGEQVIIDLTGLYAGKYAGLFEIGTADEYNGTPQIGKMSEEDFTSHTQLNGLPEPDKTYTLTMTIPELQAMAANPDSVMKYQSQRIRLNGVSWGGGGTQTWATQGSSHNTRVLYNEAKQKINVDNSGMSDFNQDILPAGHGDIEAILSYFRGAWQLVFVTNEDCFNFGGESYAPAPLEIKGEGTMTSPYNVGALREGGKTGTGVWVTGYIVGYINGKSYATDAVFSAEGAVATNILIADNPDETATENCIPLKIQGDIRSALNLKDHPDNLGKQVSVLGNIGSYFGQSCAVIDMTAYNWGDQGSEQPEQPEQPEPSGDATFKKVTSVTSGKQYVIVIDGQIGTPIASNLAYGRLTMAAVTITGDELKTSTDNAITIKAVDGGYSLTDYLGRSLDMDATHLSTFQLGATGNVWTITPVDGLFQIANVLNPNCWIVRSGTYSNIAPSDVVKYPTYDLPALYERVN